MKPVEQVITVVEAARDVRGAEVSLRRHDEYREAVYSLAYENEHGEPVVSVLYRTRGEAKAEMARLAGGLFPRPLAPSLAAPAEGFAPSENPRSAPKPGNPGREQIGRRGILSGRIITCPRCDGSLIVQEPFTQACPRCRGRGFVIVHLKRVYHAGCFERLAANSRGAVSR